MTAHLREKIGDDRSWIFGLTELERLTKARLIPERMPPPVERARVLSGIERQMAHD